MSMIDVIRKEMMTAMKNKDKERKESLSMLLSALKNAQIDKREEQIEAEINAVLAELGIDAPTMKDKGKVMKNLMPRVKGKADGKLVNQLVGAKLS